MDFPFDQIFQYGAEIALAAMFIWLLYQLNKQKKQPLNNGTNKLILEQLKEQNANHLHGISEQIAALCEKINTDNDRLIDTIHDDNRQVIQLLGEIKGLLSRR